MPEQNERHDRPPPEPANGSDRLAAGTIDEHIGASIRARRRALELTQDDLAVRIGVTAQQIHKYENGANRVAASKLFEIAAVLSMPVSSFFAGLPTPVLEEDEEARTRNRLLLDKDILELAKRFEDIKEVSLRKTVMRMLRAATESGEKPSE